MAPRRYGGLEGYREAVRQGVEGASFRAEVLSRTPPRRTLRWVRDALGGARLVSVRPLGGSWSAVHSIDLIDRSGRVRRLVLRRWARPEWEAADPDFTCRREAWALSMLEDARVPAPRLVAADPDAEACDVPALLMTRLRGRPLHRPRDRDSFVHQLASVLVNIHAVGAEGRSVLGPYRPYYEESGLVPPAWSSRAELWTRALDVVGHSAPVSPMRFIHRDYHSGNALWVGGRLTGIVDWTAASWGPSGIDVAHMRANLALDLDLRTADRFLEQYAGDVSWGFEHYPYWDLRVSVDLLPDLDPATSSSAKLRRLEDFVAAALASIGR